MIEGRSKSWSNSPIPFRFFNEILRARCQMPSRILVVRRILIRGCCFENPTSHSISGVILLSTCVINCAFPNYPPFPPPPNFFFLHVTAELPCTSRFEDVHGRSPKDMNPVFVRKIIKVIGDFSLLLNWCRLHRSWSIDNTPTPSSSVLSNFH